MNPAKRICLSSVRQSLDSACRFLPHQSCKSFASHAPSRCAPLVPIQRRGPLLRRFESSSSVAPQPVAEQPERKSWRAAPHRRPDEPVYELYFTCKVCQTRSGHSISKQAYHKGTTLVQCPDCKNRHLITDHLKIFSDKSVTIEDLMREKGEVFQRGGLDQQGEIEFWETTDAVEAERRANKES